MRWDEDGRRKTVKLGIDDINIFLPIEYRNQYRSKWSNDSLCCVVVIMFHSYKSHDLSDTIWRGPRFKSGRRHFFFTSVFLSTVYLYIKIYIFILYV